MRQEDYNHDAVAMLKSGEIVGYAPHEISQIIFLVEHNGTVSCEITRPRKRGVALVVPCHYTICCAKNKLVSKLRKKLDDCWFV